jgi:hypothetical protein
VPSGAIIISEWYWIVKQFTFDVCQFCSGE